MEARARPAIDLMDQAAVLPVVLAVALIGNRIGPKIPLLEAVPGMIILYGITMLGLAITRYAPIHLPSVAWISLVGIVVTLPWFPGSAWLLGHLKKVDFLALATPVLAYAGLAISKAEVVTFARSGWKLAVVAIMVFLGTYLGSAVIAQVVLRWQGLV